MKTHKLHLLLSVIPGSSALLAKAPFRPHLHQCARVPLSNDLQSQLSRHWVDLLHAVHLPPVLLAHPLSGLQFLCRADEESCPAQLELEDVPGVPAASGKCMECRVVVSACGVAFQRVQMQLAEGDGRGGSGILV